MPSKRATGSKKGAGDPTATNDALKRERAGTYRTKDARFTVEQSSSGWLVLDAEQTDDLGLPLARGPFATLDAAKGAILDARSSAAPVSELRGPQPRKLAPVPARTPRHEAEAPDRGASGRKGRAAASEPSERATRTRKAATGTPKAATRAPRRPDPEAVIVREIRTVDGDALRALWHACGFRSLGDDDLGLARLARRNPGLVLVASASGHVVGSALGAWDGRRGWIYHVATAESHRRQGIATRLVDQVEAGLRDLGCPEVRVNVGEDNAGARGFWKSRGYELRPTRQFARNLRGD